MINYTPHPARRTPPLGAMMKQKLVNGDEYDVVGRGRRFYTYLKRPGVASRIKRGMRVRLRREGKQQSRLNTRHDTWDN